MWKGFVVLSLAPLVALLSGWLVIGHDFSQGATVGAIELHGFPVWFREVAPGYSMADGWHWGRLGMNAVVWGVVLVMGMRLGSRKAS